MAGARMHAPDTHGGLARVGSWQQTCLKAPAYRCANWALCGCTGACHALSQPVMAFIATWSTDVQSVFMVWYLMKNGATSHMSIYWLLVYLLLESRWSPKCLFSALMGNLRLWMTVLLLRLVIVWVDWRHVIVYNIIYCPFILNEPYL